MNLKTRGMIIALALALALAAGPTSARAGAGQGGENVHREAGMADIVPPGAIGGFTGISGYLTCNVATGWGVVFGSSRKLQCVYVSVEANPDRTQQGAFRAAYNEYYTGSVAKFGDNLGYLQSGVIMWKVLAPASASQGALAGHYSGTTASKDILPGTLQNVLLGGVNMSIALTPISFVRKNFENISDAEFKAQIGLNAAAGISEMTLTLDKKMTLAASKQKPAKSTP